MLLFGASHVITSTQSPLLFAWAFASFPSVRLLVYLRVVSSLALPGRRMPSLRVSYGMGHPVCVGDLNSIVTFGLSH